jgi:hypothetical protein
MELNKTAQVGRQSSVCARRVVTEQTFQILLSVQHTVALSAEFAYSS